MATAVGIRELKDNLSEYVRRSERGERIAVTAHGRIVAELGPPASGRRGQRPSRYDQLVAEGVIRPALEPGTSLAHWKGGRLPKGTAAALIDEDRGD